MGICDFRNNCHREARCNRNRSRRLASTLINPVVTFVMMGNRLIMQAIITTLWNPEPNQVTIRGAIATMGTVWRKIA